MTKIVIYSDRMEPICIVELSSRALSRLTERSCFYIRSMEPLSLHCYTPSDAERVKVSVVDYEFTVKHLCIGSAQESIFLMVSGIEFAVDHTSPRLVHTYTSSFIQRQDAHNKLMVSLERSLESV